MVEKYTSYSYTCNDVYFFVWKGAVPYMDYLRVGTYVNTHGIRGEIKVYPHTDDISRFSDLKKVTLDTRDGYIVYNIQSVKYYKNMAIIKFEGIDNINDIEKYKGSDILIERSQAVPLNDGEYFICDIIGAEVYSDTGEMLGKIKEVLRTGANDVYVVNNEKGKELLIPVIPSCVLDVDTDNKRVKVHLLPGLTDL